MITHESSLKDFTEQIEYVLNTYENHGFNINSFDHVILGGLGGSGIAGSIVLDYYFSKFPKPIQTIKDYHLPAYTGKNSLIILNSYSGNTEETLSLFDEAIAKEATIIVLSSGGKITELAKEHQLKYYPIPTGYQPRMTVGFGLSFLLMILGDLIDENNKEELEGVINGFKENHAKQINTANNITDFFSKSTKNKFVIVSDQAMAGPAVRFTQQLNENSKLEAFVNILPESNHNVLESYTDRLNTNFIFLYTGSNERVTARFDFLMGHLEMDNNSVVPIMIPEYSIYSIFDVIYRLDWVSVNLANILDAPLMEVPIITELKEYLMQVDTIVEEEDDAESA